MRELNVDFVDLYKRVDKVIKDAYWSNEGVSEYIRQMEKNNFTGILDIKTWRTDYDKLKRMRWIRNQLSHEVGYDTDICNENDYDWLEQFYSRLCSGNDPMALMKKIEEAKRRRNIEEQRQRNRLREQQQNEATTSQNEKNKKKNIWQKIRDFFKI